MNLSLQSFGRRSVKMPYPNACFQPRDKVAMLVEKLIYIYIYIFFFFQKGFHIERYIDRYILLFSCTCARVYFSLVIVQLVKNSVQR